MTSSHNGPQACTSSARFVLHRGGRLATVSHVTAGTPAGPRTGGGLRREIRGLSPAARRRLLRLIASVDTSAHERLPSFLTLTYPREYPTDPAIYRRHARAFLKRLFRQHGERAVIWRLEFQKRGAPHFHLLIFDLSAAEIGRTWARESWYQVVGSNDPRHRRRGVDLQNLKSWRGVTSYLSKYLAKIEGADTGVHEPVGRFWGVEGRNHLQIHPYSFVLPWRKAVKLRRVMQRWAGVRRFGGQGHKGTSAYMTDDVATRLVQYFGGRLERPEKDESPPHQSRGGFRPAHMERWRMKRHRLIMAHFSKPPPSYAPASTGDLRLFL